MSTINYKTFPSKPYDSTPLPHYTLRETVEGTYALVPFTNEFGKNALASDFSISSQLKSGVSLSEVQRLQPLNRASAADLGSTIMSNVINSKQNG